MTAPDRADRKPVDVAYDVDPFYKRGVTYARNRMREAIGIELAYHPHEPDAERAVREAFARVWIYFDADTRALAMPDDRPCPTEIDDFDSRTTETP